MSNNRRVRHSAGPKGPRTSTAQIVLVIALLFVLGVALFIGAGALGLLDDGSNSADGSSLASASGVSEQTKSVKPSDGNEPATPAVTNSDKAVADDWSGESFAPSLVGTDIDGKLEADDQGLLKVSIDVKDFFDYFLGAVGERSIEDVIAMIHSQINSRLPPEAAAQARLMLDNYIDYQYAMADMMGQPMQSQDQMAVQQTYSYYAKTMRDTFEQLKALRQQYFGPQEIEAFFSMEEAYSEYALTAMELQADESLTPDARAAALKEVERILPEQMRNAEQRSRREVELSEATVALYEQGRSPEEISAALAQQYPDQFDNEATEEVIDHLKREEDFDSRMTNYLTRKQAMTEQGLSAVDRSNALKALQQENFSEAEIPRVESEEAIAETLAEDAAKQTASKNNQS